MHEKELEHLSESDYKRLTGIRRETFNKMLVEIEAKSHKFGRPPKLSCGDQLLMTLMYWREYRTQFHIAQTYGVSESHVCRTIRKIEDILVKSRKFTLPGKKVLQSNNLTFEILLVDASEQPIERPKKSNVGITAVKRSAIRKNPNF